MSREEQTDRALAFVKLYDSATVSVGVLHATVFSAVFGKIIYEDGFRSLFDFWQFLVFSTLYVLSLSFLSRAITDSVRPGYFYLIAPFAFLGLTLSSLPDFVSSAAKSSELNYLAVTLLSWGAFSIIIAFLIRSFARAAEERRDCDNG